MILYTIGHSITEMAAFIDALSREQVEVVVDVRSKPRSRLPHFDRNPLETALGLAGIRYRFLGDRLGGVPSDREVAARWRQGHLDPVIVAHLRSTDEWHDGLQELTRLLQSNGGTKVCILCSEADPNECHRKAIALDVTALIPDTDVVHLTVSKSFTHEVGVQEVML